MELLVTDRYKNKGASCFRLLREESPGKTFNFRKESLRSSFHSNFYFFSVVKSLNALSPKHERKWERVAILHVNFWTSLIELILLVSIIS